MNGANRGLFFRLSECRDEFPDVTKATIRGGIYHGMHEIADQVLEAYRGHHQYDWVRPRQTWMDAKCPVFIDFGKDHLLKMEVYDESGLPCVRVVRNPQDHLGTSEEAVTISSRRHQVPSCEHRNLVGGNGTIARAMPDRSDVNMYVNFRE